MSIKDFDVTISEYFNWCSEVDWDYISRKRDSNDNSEINLGHKIEYFKDEKKLNNVFVQFDRYHSGLRKKPEIKEFLGKGKV